MQTEKESPTKKNTHVDGCRIWTSRPLASAPSLQNTRQLPSSFLETRQSGSKLKEIFGLWSNPMQNEDATALSRMRIGAGCIGQVATASMTVTAWCHLAIVTTSVKSGHDHQTKKPRCGRPGAAGRVDKIPGQSGLFPSQWQTRREAEEKKAAGKITCRDEPVSRSIWTVTLVGLFCGLNRGKGDRGAEFAAVDGGGVGCG
jgi:hypothetical protein